MIFSIIFTDELFKDSKKSHIRGGYLGMLGMNTVVLCRNTEIKNAITSRISLLRLKKTQLENDISPTINDGTDLNKHIWKTTLDYMPTTIFRADSADIVVTVEAPMVLKCVHATDLWFADWDYEYKDSKKIVLYPFSDYDGYEKMWNCGKGIMKVYQSVCCGEIGCYKGYYEAIGIMEK